MKAEGLALRGNHLRLVDHKARHGVGLVIGQIPISRAVQIADRHSPFDQIAAIVGAFKGVGFVDKVKLVGDLAHNLFQDVFQRDQTLQGAVFIHHQSEMGAPLKKLAHLFIKRGGVRDEIGFHRHLHHIQCRHGLVMCFVDVA